ncbi:MAG: GTPase Era [Actinomycetota bacterium]|nr:GTPase Era [Actinomycetota bacterium]
MTGRDDADPGDDPTADDPVAPMPDGTASDSPAADKTASDGPVPEGTAADGGFRSGFVTLVGRPNVGKSTLLNRILGEKVTIVSDKPQTTRTEVRGVLNRPGVQAVFVDTPGIHKPRTALGGRLNETATAALGGVDVVCLVVDADAGLGRGDRFVAERVPRDAIVVVNKIDRASPQRVLEQLVTATQLGVDPDAPGQAGENADAATTAAGAATPSPTALADPAATDGHEYFPISATTGEGVDALVEHILTRLPEGPLYYPDDVVTDVPEAFWVAELVREQLLAVTREELPHSIATQVTEWEWPYIRCEILVERKSQKGMVIGKGGNVLRAVGIAVREQLPEGTYLDLHVRVDKDWQRRPSVFDRLGY